MVREDTNQGKGTVTDSETTAECSSVSPTCSNIFVVRSCMSRQLLIFLILKIISLGLKVINGFISGICPVALISNLFKKR